MIQRIAVLLFLAIGQTQLAASGALLFETVEIEGLGTFAVEADGKVLRLNRTAPTAVGPRLAINPVYTNGRPDIQIPGTYDHEIRHLRGTAPAEKDSKEVWNRYLVAMREQARILATLPTASQRLLISTDGMDFDPWPREIRRLQALMPPGVGLEIFSPLASGALGGREPGGFLKAKDLRRWTWTRRTRAAARGAGSLGGMSLTFGSFCTRRHSPVELSRTWVT